MNIYADEGKSGTKMKNRTELLRLLKDAKEEKFQVVLIKDVSRLARNTVDFLTSIRKLKSFGIQVIFVNYDQTTSQSSEFMLTMLSAIAQEESANTSKRVKFGKKQNAIKGRVPNLVYGYDKIPDDYFSLSINENEAKVIKRIFTMYNKEGYGTNRIAKELNEDNILTKRKCKWTQNSVKRILANPIYTGSIVNGKEEVKDYLTGERQAKEKEEWIITKRQELRIIDDESFKKANHLLKSREHSFLKKNEREVDSYIFSKLIYCSHCNTTFRRLVRIYKNTYVRWVCNKRNSSGVSACENGAAIEEEELLIDILDYFIKSIKELKQGEYLFINEIIKQQKKLCEQDELEVEYNQKLQKNLRKKEKYIELFQNDIITLDELKEEMTQLQEEIRAIEEILANYKNRDNDVNNDRGSIMNFSDYMNHTYLNNRILKRIIDRITVDKNKVVKVYIKNIDGE